MVDAIAPVAAGHDPVATARAAQAAAKTAAAQYQTETTTAAAKADVAAPPISPRFRPDSLSGKLVTEFVNDKGQVTAQYPSTAALNYLRVGLEADGSRKADAKPDASIVA